MTIFCHGKNSVNRRSKATFAVSEHSTRGATMPPEVTPIVVALVLASVVQIVAGVLLQYTGFFRSTALNGAVVAAMMVIASAVALFAKLDLVGFLAVYAAVYAAGAIGLMIAALYGPIRAAAHTD